MGMLDALFGQVVNTITNHASPNTPGPSYDPSPLLGQLSGLFGQHAANNNQDFNGGGYASSDQDPYGDPGVQGGQQGNMLGNIASSDQDPYGDPGAR